MAFQMELNMGIPERAILSAILELSSRKTRFTYEDIALVIPCSTPTVSRHMPKLLEAGKVKRSGQKRTGYHYVVVVE